MSLPGRFKCLISFFILINFLFLFTIRARAQSDSLGKISANGKTVSHKIVKEANTGKTPIIVVNPRDKLRPISKYLFGFNSELFFRPATARQDQGPYDAVHDRFNSKFIKRVRRAHPTIIRYPGGTGSNYFNWKQAIGPQEQRGCFYFPNLTTAPWPETFGPDENMRFVRKIDAKTNIVINENTMTPRDAADWVEYMNEPIGANPNGGKDWAKVRAANGHPAPYHVKWWEVGNETHGNPTWTSGIPSAKRAKAYAFGGTSRFKDQRVGRKCRFNLPSLSLSNGNPNQSVFVRYPPIKPGSLTLTVGGTQWSPTDNLSTAGPAAHVYEVVDSTGKITFGDGVHGAIPPRFAPIRVSYTSGPHAGFVDFYRAMKKVDPHIRVCWSTDRMDYSVLGGKPLDCVEDHKYGFRPRGKYDVSDWSQMDWHDALMHIADVEGAEARHDQATLKKSYPHANIVVTEYGPPILAPANVPSEGYLHSIDAGLYMASNLIDFINAGIPLAEEQQLYNYNYKLLPRG